MLFNVAALFAATTPGLPLGLLPDGFPGPPSVGPDALGSLASGSGSLPANSGNASLASRHCGQPSRHSNAVVATRPSAIHCRSISPVAGPYWPPLGGRTYQVDVGSLVSMSKDEICDFGAAAAESAWGSVAAAAGLASLETVGETRLGSSTGVDFSVSSVGIRNRLEQLGQIPRRPASSFLIFKCLPHA